MNPLSDLERLVAAIEHQGANIAPTYQEYMPIAFATANDCGEAGRTFFHRICRLSEKYVYRHLPPIPEGEQESFKPSSPSHTHTRTYVRT